MKKICLLLAIVLLLSGCGREPAITEPPTTTEPLDGTMATETLPVVPEYDGKLLIPFDPEREVYISLGNQDIDFYPVNDGPFVSFMILTRKHYSESEIKISIPMETSYEVLVEDYSEWYGQVPSGETGESLSLEQFMFMQDVDWRTLGQMKMATKPTDVQDPDESLEEILRFEEEMDKYRTTYDQLQASDIPEVCIYSVDILFTGLYEPQRVLRDEVVETVDIKIGDDYYTIDIGQWRFHTELPPELEYKQTGIKLSDSYSIRVMPYSDNAYLNGYALLPNAFAFTAQKDMTISGIRQYGAEVDLLGARISTSGNSMDYYWDMEQPIYVSAGEEVSIDVFVYDTRLKQYELNMLTYLMMDYEIGSQTFAMRSACCFTRMNDVWDTYFLAFEGYDIGEYYTCFYNPDWHGWWLDTLPDDWRK